MVGLMRWGVIGGSGVSPLAKGQGWQRRIVATRYGEAVCFVGRWAGKEVVFLPRHGEGHTVPPHRINYRANVLAMRKLGVQAVLATAASGALRRHLSPGTLLLPDQLLDLTSQRPRTLFEGEGAPVVHVDLTSPFCPTLRERLKRVAEELGIAVMDGGCYVCGEGPRYETAAEVRALAQLGGDVVGMTAGTEAALFREAEICYAVVAIVTNWGAGISPQPLSHAEVTAMMEQRLPILLPLFERVIATFDFADCPCRHSLDTYGEAARKWLEQ
ncbi:MAG: hypothetical protein LKKZDAJK_001215 [Candidatus Fervidibacter sp.]